MSESETQHRRAQAPHGSHGHEVHDNDNDNNNDVGAYTALGDTSETITLPTSRAGIDRLLLGTAHLINNDENDPMKVAVRVAVEQLHRKDSALRRECLTFAAEQLADARMRWHVRSAQDEILIDLLRAACLARTGKERDARALAHDSLSRARNIIQRRDDELARLDASSDAGAKLRAATLRKEPLLAIEELDAIAADAERADA